MNKELPQNTKAEQALLGAIINQNLYLYECIDILNHDHFSVDVHQEMYAKIIELADSNRKYDVIGLGQHFKNMNIDALTDGAEYVQRLSEFGYGADVRDLSKTIIDCYKRRGVIHFCENGLSRAYDAIGDEGLISDIQNDLESVNITEDKDTVINLVDHMQGVIDDAIDKANNPDKLAGVTTGIRGIDRVLGGFPRNELSIIAGRPSMGKTGLAVSIFARSVKAGENGIFFSLEMSKKQLAQRMIAEECFHPQEASKMYYSNIANKGLSGSHLKRAQSANNRIKALAYMVDDRSSLTVAKMAAEVRKRKRELSKQGKKLDFIIVDHVLLAKASDRYRGMKTQEVSEISNDLKSLAKKESLAVVALTQLNRGTEGRDDRRPTLADLKQSGTLEEDAGVVCFVYREDYYVKRREPENSDIGAMNDWRADMAECDGKFEFLIAKNRMGDVGKINMRHDIGCNAFWEEN